jgi:OOP family OmpA-OmpF porin
VKFIISSLCIAVIALGWWGATHQAVRIEAKIMHGVPASISDSVHPLTVDVSGRDILISGVVESEERKSEIIQQLNAVPGRRTVIANLKVLPLMAPYIFEAVQDQDGLRITGSAPTTFAIEEIAKHAVSGDIKLRLAVGAPETAWLAVVERGLAGLAMLKYGRLRLQDTTVTLSGLATLPQAKNAALAMFTNLPEQYAFNSNIETEDDGEPFGLTVVFDGLKLSTSGKLPLGALANLAGIQLQKEEIENLVVIAKIADKNDNFLAASVVGLNAFSHLKSGRLIISETSVVLEGVGMRQGLEAAITELKKLPSSFSVYNQTNFYDDGQPFQLEALIDGKSRTVSGKLPYGMSAADIQQKIGSGFQESFKVAEIKSEGGLWPVAMAVSLTAFSKLQQGRLSLLGNEITLSGVALTPQEGALVEEILTELPPNFKLNLALNFVDDGTPPKFEIVYQTMSGVRSSGKLPNGMQASDIALAFNLQNIQSTSYEGLIGSANKTLDWLYKLGAWLPDLDTVRVKGEGDILRIDAIASPGINFALLRKGLAQEFGANVLVKTAAGQSPSQGSRRYNAISGLLEQFSKVAWLPVYNFSASQKICSNVSKDILKKGLMFLPNKESLTVRSAQTINVLAGLIKYCLSQTDLKVEVLVQIESQDQDENAQKLSLSRARFVQDALIARGISTNQIRARAGRDSHPLGIDVASVGNNHIEIIWPRLKDAPTGN